MPANEPIPVPATPTRWMRRAAPGSMVSRTFPLSSAMASLVRFVESLEAQRGDYEIMKDGPQLADARLLAAVSHAVGDQGHHQRAAQIHPEAGAGEAQVP